MKPDDAAKLIQRAWRRHVDIQVFLYYKDLIGFSSKGNPALMLRSINPLEAKLLDNASGIHVRFRLIGEDYPPHICYKIYTHRPIEDLGHNSPKDYTHASTKKLKSKFTNNNISPKFEDDKEGWYKRHENNGWRLVASRHLSSRKMHSEYVRSDSSKRQHHNRLKRRQDVEIEKKHRKIEWLKKFYKQGMLNCENGDNETQGLIEQAADGLLQTCEKDGEDFVQDWEVDELLKWSKGLNFDDYLSDWKCQGTSAPSDLSSPTSAYFSATLPSPPESSYQHGISEDQPPSPSHAFS